MSRNEELQDAAESTGVDDLQVIDVDDVEGHGMREVAAGLGAAAILAGGGGAVASAFSMSSPVVEPPRPHITNPITTVDAATQWALDTTGSTVHSVQHTRDAALAAAATEVRGATSLVGQELTGVEGTAGQALDATQQALQATTTYAQSVKDTAVSAASTVAQGAVDTATSSVRSVSATATGTVSDATAKVATVLTLTRNTVNALETTIVATVQNLDPQAGAGVSGLGSSGWVTFSLGGNTIASVQLQNGQATVTIKTASLTGAALSAVYSGDMVHASSTASIA